MNRIDINKEAASYWDYLVETAQKTNTPIKNMGDRSVKNKMRGKKHISLDKAELYVSDVYAQFLEKSDDQVAKIVEGNGDVKHYLTKAVMISVMSPRSSQNYKRKVESNVVSYDNLAEDFDFINKIIDEGSDEYDLGISKIWDDAINSLGWYEKTLFIKNRIERETLTDIADKYKLGRNKLWQTIKDAENKIVIYINSSVIQERIKNLRDE
tara:strand:- start:2098 stop:2730 length:633 start_codon:yes stop_codon:yes gene_type:complete